MFSSVSSISPTQKLLKITVLKQKFLHVILWSVKRTSSVLPEDPGSVPSTHRVANIWLSFPSSVILRYCVYTVHTHRQYHTHSMQINLKKKKMGNSMYYLFSFPTIKYMCAQICRTLFHITIFSFYPYLFWVSVAKLAYSSVCLRLATNWRLFPISASWVLTIKAFHSRSTCFTVLPSPRNACSPEPPCQMFLQMFKLFMLLSASIGAYSNLSFALYFPVVLCWQTITDCQ